LNKGVTIVTEFKDYTELIKKLRHCAKNTLSEKVRNDFTSAVDAIEELLNFINQGKNDDQE